MREIKKTMSAAILILTLMLAVIPAAVPAFADTYPAEDNDWEVTFNGKEITSNYDSDEVAKALKGMEPGDDAKLEFTLKNDSDGEVDWWMENEVIKSFEDDNKAAEGGAYTYRLTYSPSKGSDQVLYTSEAVGGEQKKREGLHEATDALDKYIWLETMDAGSEATVTLEFAIDGETQRNNYQDTIGKIKLNFAVEIPKEKTIVTSHPDTGDTAKLKMYIILEVCAALLLIFLIIYARKSRKEGEQS